MTFQLRMAAHSSKTLPLNYSSVASLYNNMTKIYYDMDDYMNTFTFIQRAVDIGQRSLPANHPNLQSYKAVLK